MWDEPVNETISFSGISLLSDTANTTYFTLTTGDVTVLSETTLWLVLSTDDISEIFADNTLATSESDAYIYLEQSVFMDTYLNPQGPLQVTDYRNDRVRPGLTAFDLDLNLGILTQVFSESINANKLQPTELTFQDRQSTILSK